MDLVQFQDLTDHLDVLRKLTGIRIEEQYNTLLRNGWTLGATQLLRVLQATIRVFHDPMVKLLAKHFQKQPADLMISVIPHFNREIAEAWSSCYPGTAVCHHHYGPGRFSAALLDRAGEGTVCDLRDGDEPLSKRVSWEKIRSLVFATSGMILRPDFYQADNTDPVALRGELNLRPDLTTGMLLFGGFGSKVMYEIVERLEAAELPLQLIAHLRTK